MSETKKSPEGVAPKKAPSASTSRINVKIANILKAVQAGTMAIGIATQTLANMG